MLPDYSTYSLKELESCLETINQKENPDNYHQILLEMEKRLNKENGNDAIKKSIPFLLLCFFTGAGTIVMQIIAHLLVYIPLTFSLSLSFSSLYFYIPYQIMGDNFFTFSAFGIYTESFLTYILVSIFYGFVFTVCGILFQITKSLVLRK